MDWKLAFSDGTTELLESDNLDGAAVEAYSRAHELGVQLESFSLLDPDAEAREAARAAGVAALVSSGLLTQEQAEAVAGGPAVP